MPRLINYACRFEFLRRAAFAIVRDRGVGELSRHAIAHELGTSVSTVRRVLSPQASLATLALDEVALILLRRALPDEDHRIAEEFVWWRLVIASATGPRWGDDGSATHGDWGEGSLREQYQIATQGYTDQPALSDSGAAAVPGRPDPLAPRVEEHDASLARLIDRMLELLDVPDPDHAEAVRIRALLDGLNLGVCLGRLTPHEAVAALARHLSTVRVAA